MRFIVILLVSVIGHSLGEILQVKCGDETCERPSNRAVTTLRYTPDKPYKLQINAVNSEVEIFGSTDDLFYIRHGKTYGFLPKNHLREQARGNFPHTVEIDLSLLKVNQEVRERNFLHEFVKSSHSPKIEISNETTSESPKIEEKVVVTESPEVERATEYIATGIEPTVQELPTNTTNEVEKKDPTASTESDNDSGLEDDEEESESGDDEEEEEEEDFFDSSDKKLTLESEKKVESEQKLEVKPAMYEMPEENANLTQTTTQEEVQTEVIKEEDILIKTEDTKIDSIPQNETTEKVEELKVEKEEVKLNKEPVSVVEELKLNNEPSPVTEEVKLSNEPTAKVEEVKLINEPAPVMTEVKLTNEPAPVTEEINEGPQEIQQEKVEIPPFDPSLPPEVITEEPLAVPEVETTTPQMDIIEPPIVQEEVQTTPTPQIEPIEQEVKPAPATPSEDMLLRRFDEKLSHKTHEHEGIGSVEQVHSHSGHSHEHIHSGHSHQHSGHSHSHAGHSHEHNGHSHSDHSHEQHVHSHLDSHSHNHEEVTTEQPAIIENLIEDSEERKPGFLAGMFKTIFGDKKESIENERAKVDEGFCEKIDSENCPQTVKTVQYTKEDNFVGQKTFDQYINMFLNEALQKMDLIISLGLTSLTTLIFIFGYYCINRARKESPLIARVNELERHLMASSKENEMLKGDIVNAKQKLTSIEDNSFGSNDMVIALKQELEESEQTKADMAEKISSLEKELEAAAEDGLELNKMVSELLSNQNGSDSIISSVEDLQLQLNEQQDTIITMNETLAAKSRENTELQIQLAEFNNKTLKDIETYQQEMDAIALERSNLQVELENLKRESDIQVNQIVEERNGEVTRLNSELTLYAGKFEETKKLLNSSESRVQALEECIDALKKNKGGDFKNIFDVADLKADLLAVTKEKSTLQEQLQSERDSRKLLEDRAKSVGDEMSNLKKEYGVAEKEKLEAQTRLDVLSTYFKETEMRLQLELSEEKARAMKQQGETTSTVEKIQALNDEIQALRSQNDTLRAEIEAQEAAHKLKISSIEGQAHTAWLNARQADRKVEEARMEAAALRRRLTSIAENPSGATDFMNGLPPVMSNDSLNAVPSPMRVESPNMTSMASQPPMMMPPPPFMPGFLPPPFLPPGEMGGPMLPPLGRLMSPPPKRFTPTMRDERDRYSPRRGGRYSPDSRYDDYTAFETETDYSPPPSPRRGYNSPPDRNKKSKGGHSSPGSDSGNQPSNSRRKNRV